MSDIKKTFRSPAFIMCKSSPGPGISKPGWLEFPWVNIKKKNLYFSIPIKSKSLRVWLGNSSFWMHPWVSWWSSGFGITPPMWRVRVMFHVPLSRFSLAGIAFTCLEQEFWLQIISIHHKNDPVLNVELTEAERTYLHFERKKILLE